MSFKSLKLYLFKFLFLLFILQQWVTFSLKRFFPTYKFPSILYISLNQNQPSGDLILLFYFNPVKIIHISLLSGKKYFCTLSKFQQKKRKKVKGYEKKKRITFQRQRQIRALTSGFLLFFFFFNIKGTHCRLCRKEQIN